MLISPLPGVNPQYLRDTLQALHTDVSNVYTAGPHDWRDRLLTYLDWANEAVSRLASLVSAADVDRLVLTRRYTTLLAGVSHFREEEIKLVNGLVGIELRERVTCFEQALKALDTRISTWSQPGVFAVADTSFYIHHPETLDNADLAPLCGTWPDNPVHLIIPIVVVDELDNLKRSKDRRTRGRASYTIAVMDRMLDNPSAPVVLRHPGHDKDGAPRAGITMELLLDPPGHVRLPIADDEIVDRAVAVKTLAGREVHLLTYDTGQALRAKAASLRVNKLRETEETRGPV